MNWLYYKTNRNILVTVIFHITAVYFNEIFSTHPNSKCIQNHTVACPLHHYRAKRPPLLYLTGHWYDSYSFTQKYLYYDSRRIQPIIYTPSLLIHIWLFPLEIIADTYLRSAASYSLFISPFSINDFREVVRILCSKFSFGFEIFLRWEFFGCIRATRNCGRYCGTCAVHFYWKVMSSCQCRSFLTLQCVRMSSTIHSASKVREVM